jgi:hypothetical protein
VLLVGTIVLIVVIVFAARDYTERQAVIDHLEGQGAVPRVVRARKSELRTHLVWYGVAAGAVVLLTLAVAGVVRPSAAES